MKRLLLHGLFFLLSLATLTAQQSAVTLTAPSPASVTGVTANVIGNTGNATYYYFVVASYAIGNAPPTNGVLVASAPSALSSANYILVSWQAMTGATGYTLLRTTVPTLPATCTACLVATTTTATAYSDQGGALTSYTVNTAPTAQAQITLDNQTASAPFLNYVLNNPAPITGLNKVPTLNGSVTAGHCLQVGTNPGQIVDAGSTCSAAGGGITALTGDVTATGPGSAVATVKGVNGVTLSGLASGLLYNTTSTGVPSIATSANVISLFTGCSGTQYLGADGACHTATSTPAFSSITSGTNTGATMLVGTGASLAPTGTGTLSANQLNGTSLSGLASGLLFNTTTTGVPSIATSTQILTAVGNIPVTSLNSGTSASSTTFWRGDATWSVPFTLTTTGTSGAATFSGGTLNVPNYTSSGGGSFSAITSGTNTSAAMVVGAGSSLTASGGTIVATSLGGTFAAHNWLGNPTGSTSSFTTNTIGTSDTSVNWYGTATGTATAYTVTLSQPATAYTSGLVVSFTPNVANTGAGPTLALNTLSGSKSITKCGTTALVANDLTTTAVAQVVYDGTEFQLLNPQAIPCSPGGLVTGTASASSGYILLNGATSGASGFSVPNAAGTSILYLLPSTAGTSGQLLSDTGTATCPTLVSGAPSNCHQLSWTAASGGALTRIAQVVTSGSQTSIPFTSIPGGYTSLQLTLIGRSNTNGTGIDDVKIQFNSDTGNNYQWQFAEIVSGPGNILNSTSQPSCSVATLPEASSTANVPSIETVNIIGYSQTTFYKSATSSGLYFYGTSTPNLNNVAYNCQWYNTAAITSASLFLASGSSFVNGTIATLYGVQ